MKKFFHTMEVNNEKAIDAQNKCCNMKHMKEKCDMGDNDELKQITAARTFIKKEQRGVCDM